MPYCSVDDISEPLKPISNYENEILTLSDVDHL